MPAAIRSVCFVPNRTKPDAAAMTRRLTGLAARHGIRVGVAEDFPLPPDTLRAFDLCCVIGGDGTLLSVVPQAHAFDTALIGVNLGKLGFLSTLSERDLDNRFDMLLDGGGRVQERAVFAAKSADGSHAVALNDLVLKESRGYGLVRLQVKVEGHRVSEYHSDGLIFSTPTGSTAYNLSAGGPIVAPGARVFVMTPICPHTLGNRSVIFDSDTVVEIENLDSKNAPTLSVDGRILDGPVHFPLEVGIDPKPLRFLQTPDYAPFRIVRKKLKWGDPAIGGSPEDDNA